MPLVCSVVIVTSVRANKRESLTGLFNVKCRYVTRSTDQILIRTRYKYLLNLDAWDRDKYPGPDLAPSTLKHIAPGRAQKYYGINYYFVVVKGQ
jgi:hypothetical protein